MSRGAISYEEFPPPPSLARHVERFWTFAGPAGGTERIVPDGRAELVVHLAAPYAERTSTGRWRRQPSSLVAGQLTRPLWLRAKAPVSVVSARLQPAALGVLVGAAASACTDRRIPLAVLAPDSVPALQHALRTASSGRARVDVLADWLARRVAHGRTLDRRVVAAVRRLELADPPTVESLAAELAVTPRQLERLFAQHVGVPPRLYARLQRFRRVFDVLGRGPGAFTRAAMTAGYFDHPEMARDFRRFVGCTARQFVAELDALAAAMSRPRTTSG